MKKWMAITVFLALFIFAAFNATHGVLLNSFIEHYDLETARQGFPAAAQNIGCAIALLISFQMVRAMGKERVLALWMRLETELGNAMEERERSALLSSLQQVDQLLSVRLRRLR